MSEYIVSDELDVLRQWMPKLMEIVRCRDCKHYNEQEPGGEIGTCDLGLEDLDLCSIVEPDGFCAWGEMRES